MNNQHTLATRWITSALLPALLAAGCSSLHTAEPRTDSREARTQIERRLQQVFDAAENKDFDRLDGYHLYGPKFTKFSGSAPQRLDAEAGQKGEHNGLGSLKGLKMRADDLKIDVFGDVGIATFTLDYAFESGGGTTHGKERATLVFVKEGGAWKIAHEHLSPIK